MTFSIFQLDEPSLELGREYLINGLDDDAVKAYYKFMVENAIVFGANRSQAANEMKEALELEFRLAKVRKDFNASLLLFYYFISTLFFSFCSLDHTSSRRASECNSTIQSIHNKIAAKNLSIFELVGLYQFIFTICIESERK